MTILHARTIAMVHACTMAIEHARIMAIVQASIMVIVHAFTMVIVHLCQTQKRDWTDQCRFFDISSASDVANFNTMLSWAPALAHFHGKPWVDARRIFSTSHGGTRVSSRTGTRVAPGKVLERWHDRIDFCKRMVA